MSDVANAPAQETPNAAAAATVLTEKAVEQVTATTTEPAKTETQKPAEQTKPAEPIAPVVPEKYELKVPEGSRLSSKDVEKVASFAKERKLSNEQAQMVLERESSAVSEFEKGQQESLKIKALEWIGEIKNDRELGGENYNKNVELAKRVVSRFASESLRKVLDDTGLGNNPELVRAFSRIGKVMSEDQLVLPGAQHLSGGKRDPASVLYSTNKKEGA